MTEPAAATDPIPGEPGDAGPSYVQLTQVRVPLRGAGDALATPDEMGRYPIMAIIERTGRFRAELLLLAAAVAAVTVALSLPPLPTAAGFAAAIVILLAGSSRAIFTAIPEGSRAVLMRGGRVYGVAGSGVRVMNPAVIVSHVIAVREVPFWAAVRSIPTSDDIRVDVQILVSFRIDDPARFVFNTTAADFDFLCQGASQTAIRLILRQIDSSRVLDLATKESDEMRELIERELEPFGVLLTRVLVVRVEPPAEFLSSVEASKLAALRLSEQKQQFELDRRVQTDQATLALNQTQQQMQREMEQVELNARARRREAEFEADRESFRLARLEERLAAYPAAARWDWAGQKLEVARALAGNSRAMVQLGGDGDVGDVILRRTLLDADDETTLADIVAATPSGETAFPTGDQTKAGDTAAPRTRTGRGTRPST